MDDTDISDIAATFELCGGLRVNGPDGTVDDRVLGGRRGRRTLAVLLVGPDRALSREGLADLVWPDGVPATWASALRTALSDVRATCRAAGLPDDTLDTGGGLVRLRIPDGVRVDLLDATAGVRRAEAALGGTAPDPSGAARSAADAAAVLAAPPLPEFDDEWAEELRRTAHVLRVRALDALATASLRLGDPTAAAGAATSLLELEPLHEPGHRLLMAALAATGNRGGALQAYQRCRAVLADELGAAPSAETDALYVELLGEGAAPPSPADDAPGTALPGALRPRDDLPFVGRDRELEALGRWWSGVAGGTTGLALIRGEAGIGKSRLARELAGRVHADGGTVLYARFDDDEHSTLRPLLTLAGGTVPGVAVTPDPGDDRRAELLEDWAGAVLGRAGPSGLLLVVDDVQWAGTAALSALGVLLRAAERASAPAGVVATVRTSDVDVAGPAAHPVRDLLAAAARDERSVTVSLSGLDTGDVAALLSHLGGAALDRRGEELADAVRQQADGNPFFVGESLRHLIEEGEVRCDDGVWSGTVDGDAAPAVRDVVAARVAALGDDAASALRVAAVIGPSFELTVLGDCLDGGLEAAVDAADLAVRAHLVRPVRTQPGTCRFVHAVVRSTLLDELGEPRRLALHRRIGLALEHSPDRPGRAAELARHFTAAAPLGEVDRAVRHSLAAAGEAVRGLAYEQAAEVLRAALELPVDDARRSALLLELAGAEIRSGDSPEAHEAFLEAADCAARTGDGRLRARAALGAMRGHRGGSDWLPSEEGRRLALDALDSLPEDEVVLRIELLSQVALRTNDGAERHELAARATRLAEEHDTPAAVAAAYGASRIVLWAPADTERRLRFSDRVLAAATALGDRHLAAVVRAGRTGDLLQMGDRAAAAALVAELADDEAVRGSRRLRWQLRSWPVVEAFADGRLDEAEGLATDALAEWGDEPHADALQAFGSQIALLRQLQGRPDEVVDLVAPWVASHPEVRGFRAVLSWMLCETGRPGEAAELLDDISADDWRGVARDNTFPIVVTALAETCRALGDAERSASLLELGAPLAGQLVFQPGLGLYLGPADHALGILALTAGDADRARRHLEAAVDLAAATGGPLWVERSRSVLDGAG